jgi:hypothetical protein
MFGFRSPKDAQALLALVPFSTTFLWLSLLTCPRIRHSCHERRLESSLPCRCARTRLCPVRRRSLSLSSCLASSNMARPPAFPEPAHNKHKTKSHPQSEHRTLGPSHPRPALTFFIVLRIGGSPEPRDLDAIVSILSSPATAERHQYLPPHYGNSSVTLRPSCSSKPPHTRFDFMYALIGANIRQRCGNTLVFVSMRQALSTSDFTSVCVS